MGRHARQKVSIGRAVGKNTAAGRFNSVVHDSVLLARRRRQRRRRRILKVVATAFAVVLIGAGTAFGVYMKMLNDRLALDDESRSELDSILSASDINEPFYLLVLGSDSREGSGTSSREDESGDNERSDVIILTRIDAPNRQITMVSIPRDTPLYLEDGSVVKINEAYNLGGAAYTVEAVSELTGVPISHYAEIHFSELEDLVDSLGGVTVNVPIELSYQDALTGETVTLYPGEQTLDGQQAQIFARARHEYGENQDANRQNAVRQLAFAILEKALDRPIYELPGTILEVADLVGTDLTASDLIWLASTFAGGSGDITMYSGSGPTDGDYNEACDGLWLCYENPEGWELLMSVVDAGGDPSTVDYSNTQATAATPTSS